MKQLTSLIALTAFFTLIFSACTIQKRHYMPGYHVEWHKKTDARSADATTDQSLFSSESEEKTEGTSEELRSQTTVTNEQPIEEQIISEESATTDPVNKADKLTVSENGSPVPSVESTSQKKAIKQLSVKKDPQTHDHPRIVLAILFLLLGIFPLSVYFTEGKTQNFRISLVVSILFYLCILVATILVIAFVLLTTTAITAAGIAGLGLMLISILIGAMAFIHALIVFINKMVRG